MKQIPFLTLLAAGIFFLFSSSAAMALGIVDLSGNTAVTTTTVEPVVVETEDTGVVEEGATEVVKSTESSYDQGKSRHHRRDAEHRRKPKKDHHNKKDHHKKHKSKKRWY